MSWQCEACGRSNEEASVCTECGRTAPTTHTGEDPSQPPSPAPASIWQSKGFLAMIGALAVLIVVIVVVTGRGDGGFTGAGGDTRVVIADHPSGIRVEARVAGSGDVEIEQVSAGSIDLEEHLDPLGVWSVAFDGEVVGDAAISMPAPPVEDFSVLIRRDGVWRPTPFSVDGRVLEIRVGGGEAATAIGRPATEGVLAAGDGGWIALDTGFWSEIELAIASIDIGSLLDELLMTADREGSRLLSEIIEFADPPMCSHPASGASIDEDRNARSLVRACVEDRDGAPVIKVGNNTRFALEFSAIGVDVERLRGGTDMSIIGSRGVVTNGGDTTEWEAASGSTFTLAAEFTEYAFLKQVTSWIIGLIPAGSEVLERGEDIAEAIGVLQDALAIATDLDGLIGDLERGEYRAAFSDIAGLLTQQRVIEELIDRGFFERLGYSLAEDTVDELFSALDLAGYLGDLGDLIYRTWATGGYVHGEVVIRLPSEDSTAASTTTPAPSVATTTTTTTTTTTAATTTTTTTAATTTTTTTAATTTVPGGEPVVEVDSLGSQTAGTQAYRFDLPADFTRIRVAFHDHDDQSTTYRYGGWAAEMSVNGTPVYEWIEFDGTDSIYRDFLAGIEEYGRNGVGEWWDITGLVTAGENEIVYYHFNEGPGIGIKLEVTSGGPGQPGGTTDTLPPDLGTGDVQVTLLWDSVADLDLHVIDPAGDEVSFRNRQVPSGGELDVDTNASCGGAPNPVENVFWPDGEAPRGGYRSGVDFYSTCGGSSSSGYTIIVHIDGAEAYRWSGSVGGADGVVWYDFDY